jgi:hypothetical protein
MLRIHKVDREFVRTIHCSLAGGMLSSRPIVGNAIETDVVFEICEGCHASDRPRSGTSRLTFTIIESAHAMMSATDLSILGVFAVDLLIASCWSRIGSIGGCLGCLGSSWSRWSQYIGAGGGERKNKHRAPVKRKISFRSVHQV